MTEDTIATAARWLSEHWHVAPQPITKTLREMFGLKFNDAVRAMASAKRIIAADRRDVPAAPHDDDVRKDAP